MIKAIIITVLVTFAVMDTLLIMAVGKLERQKEEAERRKHETN